MKIRKGLGGDAERCLEIAKLNKATHWTLEDFKNSATDNHAGFFVTEDKKKVVGYILGFVVPTRHSESLIHETRVDKLFRKKGLGAALVEHFCKYMFRKGVKTISALVDPKHLKFYVGACKFRRICKWIEVSKVRE